MKKKINILFISSCIVLIISIFLWIDIYKQEILLRNNKLNNIETGCLEKLEFFNGLLDILARKELFTTQDLNDFFTYEGISLLEKVNRTNFELKSMISYYPDKNCINDFDIVLQLKSTTIFFLFKDNYFVGIISGCDLPKKNINNYLKSKGNYKIDD